MTASTQFMLNSMRSSLMLVNQTSVRCMATHWNPKFKKLRKNKVVKLDIPDFNKMRNNDMINETPEERRKRAIKEGMEPTVNFEYKPINITSSAEIFDPYVPVEGDGKASLFTKSFVSQKFESIKKSTTTMLKHNRVVKKYDESFENDSFADFAQDIYIKSHEALMNRDAEKMLEYVTENAYSKMWVNMKFKSIKWKWIESLEKPVVKHIITREMIAKSNVYAQVTVRVHSKQILAVYDRFGRLAFGSETLPKDVLEFLVFERHLTNPYGVWRLHDKIEPEWAGEKTPILRSYIMPKLYEIDASLEEKEKELSKFKKDDSHLNEEKEQPEQKQLQS